MNCYALRIAETSNKVKKNISKTSNSIKNQELRNLLDFLDPAEFAVLKNALAFCFRYCKRTIRRHDRELRIVFHRNIPAFGRTLLRDECDILSLFLFVVCIGISSSRPEMHFEASKKVAIQNELCVTTRQLAVKVFSMVDKPELLLMKIKECEKVKRRREQADSLSSVLDSVNLHSFSVPFLQCLFGTLPSGTALSIAEEKPPIIHLRSPLFMVKYDTPPMSSGAVFIPCSNDFLESEQHRFQLFR